jgi:HEAT repeat protein
MVAQIGTAADAQRIVKAYAETDNMAEFQQVCDDIFGKGSAQSKKVVTALAYGTVSKGDFQQGDGFSKEFVDALVSPKSGFSALQQRARRFADTVDSSWLKSPVAREAAIVELGVMRSPEGVIPLARALHDSDEGVRTAAAKTLSAMPKVAIPILTNALKDNNWRVRSAAAEALGLFGQKAKPAIEGLSKLVKEDGWDEGSVAAAAMRSLVKIDPKGQHPATISAVESALWFRTHFDEKHPGKLDLPKVRAAGIEAAGQLGPAARPVAEALGKIATHNSAKIRWGQRMAATEALAKLGPAAEKAVPALQEATYMVPLKELALKALGAIGPAARPALPRVLQFVASSEKRLQDAAEKARRNIDVPDGLVARK